MTGWNKPVFPTFEEAKVILDTVRPKEIVFDTETTGLNIINDKPFLAGIGFKPYRFLFNDMKLLDRVMKLIPDNVTTWAWNTKFDMHMLRNAGVKIPHKVSDGMILARLATDSLTPKEGGETLKLKNLAAKYVSANAKDGEDKIAEIKAKISASRTTTLKVALKQFGEPPIEYKKTGKEKSWTKGIIEYLLSDPVFSVEDLPEDIRDVYKEWASQFTSLEPTYKDIYDWSDEGKSSMEFYLGGDLVWTWELIQQLKKVTLARGQMKTYHRERELIWPLFEMERVGFATDVKYLKDSRVRLYNEIKMHRKTLVDLTGLKFRVGQHALIKEIAKDKFGLDMLKTNKEAMLEILDSDAHKNVKLFFSTIINLRTLEKWISTYIDKWLDMAIKNNGRVYTSLNQSGAITGRFTSDFQQFPRDPIKNAKGEELFYPRKMVVVSKGYDCIVAKDYDQVESKIQAHYTYKVTGGKGDLNLMRTCVPFKCYDEQGVEYDAEKDKRTFMDKCWYTTDINKFKNSGSSGSIDGRIVCKNAHGGGTNSSDRSSGRKDILEYRTGTSVRELDMNNTVLLQTDMGRMADISQFLWKPDDMHYRTAVTAWPELESLDRSDPTVKKKRNLCKPVYFGKQYGMSKQKAMRQFEKAMGSETASRVYDALNDAFPDVKTYQRHIIKEVSTKGVTDNAYGRKYYISRSDLAYKACNYVIQGTGADLIKEKIIDISKFLKEGNYKTRMIMTIHDEILFEYVNEELHLMSKILDIMSTADWCIVPITSGCDLTTTTWAEKKDIGDVNEFLKARNANEIDKSRIPKEVS